ncbi:MAG: FkbM family methyltransferase [Alphaproteobacteria bacterium]|nr:FkbM family methyltransferase [Alphaproteobacteria bacterium]
MKPLILSTLRRFGYDLVPSPGRNSLYGVLANASRCGFTPLSVIDVGAGKGCFTREAHRLFPKCTSFLMIEPLDEFEPALKKLAAELPAAHLIKAVASDRAGTIVLNVHPDLFGSSLLREDEESDVNGVPRLVISTTLDIAARDSKILPSHLLKLDVQGAELQALSGATDLLHNCGLIILETSFYHFFGDAPLFHDVVTWMAERGFLPYDMFGLAHRPLDGALAQVDLVFVPKDSPLRKNHFYATAKQRESLTKRLRS